MTRSHKYNDRDHNGLAEGTADADQHLPRYFSKHGHVDADPKKVKKEGGGKGNWCVLPFSPVALSSIWLLHMALLDTLTSKALWQPSDGVPCTYFMKPEECRD